MAKPAPLLYGSAGSALLMNVIRKIFLVLVVVPGIVGFCVGFAAGYFAGSPRRGLAVGCLPFVTVPLMGLVVIGGWLGIAATIGMVALLLVNGVAVAVGGLVGGTVRARTSGSGTNREGYFDPL